MDDIIGLHDGSTFRVRQLVEYIENSGRIYIIQGQQTHSLIKHTKPSSLDVWLRQNVAHYADRKQADTEVIQQLVDTGLFRRDRFICPDSGFPAKGIELIV